MINLINLVSEDLSKLSFVLLAIKLESRSENTENYLKEFGILSHWLVDFSTFIIFTQKSLFLNLKETDLLF